MNVHGNDRHRERTGHRQWRLAVIGGAALAALISVPAAWSAPARAGGTAAAGCPWVTSTAPIDQRVSQLMSQLTLADKITLVEGHGSANAYVFYTPAIPSLCIPAVGLEDGPGGVADGMTGVTQLPAGVSLAATWDPALARQYGSVIGAEENGKGASANLGPTVNIDRDPRWGRSFESLSEDPYLNSTLDVPEIDGIQRQDVEDQVKHYDAYNQETYRNTPADDVVVSDRALHEIYMPSFYSAVTAGHAASVMCAYSYVNGNASCNNSYLETTVLRDQWNFPGFVMSDYGALHSTQGAVEGTDQEQPFNTYYGTALQTAVENGTIGVSALNTMVQPVLTEMFKFGLFNHPRTGATGDTVTTPAHQTLAAHVAEAGTTLLRNKGATLPLAAQASVAVIGPAASVSPVYAGGGSAYVIPSSTVTPLAGLQVADSHVTYAQGLPADTSMSAVPAADLSPAYPAAGTPFGGSYTGTLTAPSTGTYVLGLTNPCGCYTSAYLSLNGKELIDNPSTPPVHTYSASVYLTAGTTYTVSISGDTSQLLWATPADLAPGISAAVAAAKSASTAVVVVSDDTESEATDRPSLSLPSAQDELISAVAAANPHTVVVIDAGAPVAMPWLSKVAAVVDSWYPGQASGTALASVLFGQTDPAGHLPVTFPTALAQVPASSPSEFPGNGSEVLYSEGVDVGYRWYDAKGETPLFPFGYGLSYTTFAFSGLRIGRASVNGTSNVRVSAVITNTGSRAGSDVAQLYVGDPGSTGEPPRQLAGFTRVTLAPGQSAPVSFTLSPQQLSWWGSAGWTESTGTYRVYLGDSSAAANLPLHGSFAVTATPGARQVAVTAPSTVTAGKAFTARVTLTAGGNQTLHGVRLAVQLPQGWRLVPTSRSTFGTVRAGQAIAATFRVTPPDSSPTVSAVVHATATMGAATRENGFSVTVG
jgi:beta-glucosidase